MAEEVTHLIIKVSSEQAAAAKQRLDAMGLSAQKAEKATDGLGKTSGAVGRIIGAFAGAAAVGGAVAALTKLFNVARQFENLNAQLVTATGSAAGAKVAFDALQDFAKQTPYDLAQTVEAFIQLTNRGLTPSERALRSYGNTASAMGKDLKDLVLAVSNATTGEFETLKQFGVKARTEAEGVRFIFRGTSTLVKNDAKSIEDYFIKLGESNFANSMTEKMKTLGGAVSNLGDAWDQLFNEIGKTGAADLMRKAVVAATDAITELTDMVASGELGAYIDALFLKFSVFGEAIQSIFNLASDVITSAFKWWSKDGNDTANFLTKAFTQFPENLRAAMKLVGASFGALYEVGKASAIAFTNVWLASFRLIGDIAVATGRLVATAINPLKAPEALKAFTAEAGAAFNKFGQVGVAETKRVVDAVDAVTEAWEESVVATLDERDTALKSFDAQIDKAKKLRAEYDALQASKAAGNKGKDRLEGFKVGGDDRIVSEQERRRFEALKEQLQLEEISITDSYKKRLELIRDNTKEGSDLRLELERALQSKVTEEMERAFQDRTKKVITLEQELRDAVAQGRTTDADFLRASLKNEEDAIKQSYALRKQQILDDTSITEEQRAALMTSLETKYTEQQRRIEEARRKASLSQAADFFGNISQMASAFGKKGARIAKAAAIAQTTIKTYESATSAYASLAGIPYVGPVLGAAAAGAAIAAGLANVAAIKAQDYAGEYAMGGSIPAGKVGLVGETGRPEFVRGPATVTGVNETAKLLGGGKTTIIINNNAGVDVRQTGESDGPDGRVIEVMISKVKADLTDDVRSGKSFARTLQSTFGLNRASAA